LLECWHISCALKNDAPAVFSPVLVLAVWMLSVLCLPM
jgi:hypothetical protein